LETMPAALPPWWITNKIVPGGPVKDMGTWKAVSFSEDQRDAWAVDEEGKIEDQAKFDAKLAQVQKVSVAHKMPHKCHCLPLR